MKTMMAGKGRIEKGLAVFLSVVLIFGVNSGFVFAEEAAQTAGTDVVTNESGMDKEVGSQSGGQDADENTGGVGSEQPGTDSNHDGNVTLPDTGVTDETTPGKTPENGTDASGEANGSQEDDVVNGGTEDETAAGGALGELTTGGGIVDEETVSEGAVDEEVTSEGALEEEIVSEAALEAELISGNDMSSTLAKGPVTLEKKGFFSRVRDAILGEPEKQTYLFQNLDTNNSITVESDCKTTIRFSNLRIDAKEGCALNLLEGADVTLILDGESEQIGAESFAAIHVAKDAKLTIEGTGTLSARGGVGAAGIGGNINEGAGEIIIKDGVITAKGGDESKDAFSGAGIGGGGSFEKGGNGGSLRILGGTVTADGGNKISNKGGSGAGAGIGGGGGSTGGDGGKIVISGGDIHANGGENSQGGSSGAGAGIGGGGGFGNTVTSLNAYREGNGQRNQGGSGDIEITGGTICAKGGNAGNGGAAGIGGGGHGTGGNITISHADITSEGGGGNGGAGIGGGNHSSAGDILIKSGNITAIGNGGGAGIGSGQGASSSAGTINRDGNIRIDGGTIHASGGQLKNISIEEAAGDVSKDLACDTDFDRGCAAGIGGGYAADGGSIEITGGTIYAVGTAGGAGIGAGRGASSFKKFTNDGEFAQKNMTEISISGGNIYARGLDDTSGNSLIGGTGIGTGRGGTGGTVHIGAKAKVQAIAARGASAIGCGVNYYAVKGYDTALAKNRELSSSKPDAITIDDGSRITAYADGTRFAIDTNHENDGTEDRAFRGENSWQGQISGHILQGTFMDQKELTGVAVDAWQITSQDGKFGQIESSLQLPAGYRSFAVTTNHTGSYLVQIKSKQNADKFAVYNIESAEKYEFENLTAFANTEKYGVSEGLNDQYFLYVDEAKNIETPEEPPTETPGPGGGDTPSGGGGGGGGSSRPETTIPDSEVPAGTLPDETVTIPDEEIPAGELSTNEEIIIPDEAVPAGAAPSEEVLIPEQEIPAGQLPRTGGIATEAYLLIGFLAIAGGLALRRKESK